MPNMQTVIGASILAPARRVLRRSRWLRRVYNGIRTDADLLQTTHIPEDTFSQSVKDELLDLVSRLGQDSLGDYLEFGVFNGRSLSCAYRVLNELNLDHVRCIGFDSFEGLPWEAAIDDGGAWFPGQFACRMEVAERLLNERGVDWDRVKLVKGWFSDTLNQETIERCRIGSTSVVMIDCDLYSSTVSCLEFIAPLLTDHATVIFDDWYSHELAEKNLGERQAFDEFLARHPTFRAEGRQGYNEFSRIVRLTRT